MVVLAGRAPGPLSALVGFRVSVRQGQWARGRRTGVASTCCYGCQLAFISSWAAAFCFIGSSSSFPIVMSLVL